MNKYINVGKICFISFIALLCYVAMPFATYINNNVYADVITCYFEYVQIVDENNENTLVDFTSSQLNKYNAFVGQVVELSMCASEQLNDLSLMCDNQIKFLDNSPNLTNGTLLDGEYRYTKQIKCETVGDYSITLVSKLGDDIYYDSVYLTIYDNVKNVSIISNDNFINSNQEVKYTFVYNNHKELLCKNNFKIAFDNGNEEIVVNNDDYSMFYAIKSLNSSEMVIDTSRLSSDWQNFKFTITVNNKSATEKVLVKDYVKPNTVILHSVSATFNLNDKIGTCFLYMNKNSKPSIDLIDGTNSVAINGIRKVESDKTDYDKIAVDLDLLKEIDFANILLIIDGEVGEIYKSIGISIIENINTITLKTEKTIFANKEDVIFNVSVNGYDNYASKVRWFVKDIEIENTDAELDLKVNGGTYNVYAEIDGVKSNTITVIVKYSGSRQLFWYILLGVSVLGIIILTITRKKKSDIDLFKPLDENIDDLDACVKMLIQKYSRKKAFKLFKDLGIVKEKCYRAYIENEEHLYKIASQNLDKAYKNLKKLVFTKKSNPQINERLNAILNHLQTANDALLEYRRICVSD